MKLNTLKRYQYLVDVWAYKAERQESGQILKYYYLLDTVECDATAVKPLGFLRLRTKARFDSTYHMRGIRDKSTGTVVFRGDLGKNQNFAIITVSPITNPLGDVEEWEYLLKPETAGATQ